MVLNGGYTLESPENIYIFKTNTNNKDTNTKKANTWDLPPKILI